jgi:hypothetical protein
MDGQQPAYMDSTQLEIKINELTLIAGELREKLSAIERQKELLTQLRPPSVGMFIIPEVDENKDTPVNDGYPLMPHIVVEQNGQKIFKFVIRHEYRPITTMPEITKLRFFQDTKKLILR